MVLPCGSLASLPRLVTGIPVLAVVGVDVGRLANLLSGAALSLLPAGPAWTRAGPIGWSSWLAG